MSMRTKMGGAAPKVFKDSKYQSTNTMKFRGQDKAAMGNLGGNPNVAQDEDYIQIL